LDRLEVWCRFGFVEVEADLMETLFSKKSWMASA